MNADFAAILDDCLARLRRGESLEECLATYPALAEELRPLLTTALEIRQLPAAQARPAAVEEGQRRMLAALATARSPHAAQTQAVSGAVSGGRLARYTGRVQRLVHTLVIGKETNRMKIALRVSVMLCVVLALAGTATVGASANSLPGDPLYDVKRTWEEVQLNLTSDAQARQDFEAQLLEKRKDEVDALVRLKRQATFEVQGMLEAIAGERWTVSGLTFAVTDETVVVGEPAIGMRVRVRGRVELDGTLIALRIHALPIAPPPPFPTIVPTVNTSPLVTPTRPVNETPWPPTPTRPVHETPWPTRTRVNATPTPWPTPWPTPTRPVNETPWPPTPTRPVHETPWPTPTRVNATPTPWPTPWSTPWPTPTRPVNETPWPPTPTRPVHETPWPTPTRPVHETPWPTPTHLPNVTPWPTPTRVNATPTPWPTPWSTPWPTPWPTPTHPTNATPWPTPTHPTNATPWPTPTHPTNVTPTPWSTPWPTPTHPTNATPWPTSTLRPNTLP